MADGTNLRVGDENARLRVGENAGLATQMILDLRQPKRRINRHGNGAGEQNAEEGDEEVAIRGQHDRDALSGMHAALDQSARHGAGAMIEIPICERFRGARASPQQHMPAVAVTLRVTGERIDQCRGLDRFFHRLEARRHRAGTSSRFGNCRAGGENRGDEIVGAVGLADQALRKLHLEPAIQPQQQFRAGKTVERKIAIEVAIEPHEARIDQFWMQLDDEFACDLQHRRADLVDRWRRCALARAFRPRSLVVRA